MTDLFEPTRVRTIKAISLWQPWASLMAAGFKLHETRHWSTDYRGPIAIHAVKTLDLAGAPDQLCRSAFGAAWMAELPLGAVVAIGRLRGVRHASDIEDRTTRADRAAGNFAIGRFAWEIDQLRALGAPIPLVGRQALFNWAPPDDLEDRLGPILDHRAICVRFGWA